jgi:hypothetical protein
MMNLKYLIIVLMLILNVGCKSDRDNFNNILGEWKCNQWTSKSSLINKCNDQVKFIFRPDKSYSSFLGVEESGTFFIETQMLHVSPKDKMKFSVKIQTNNKDSLVLLMNSGGELEEMILTKVD